MTRGSGSQELVRIATAYLASIAFCVTFLVATLAGASGLTALLRGAIATAATAFAAPLLAAPVVNTVLEAMARDEARRKAAEAKKAEENS
ncbi:MAG: hypothetical protein U1E73_00490 [Planctomycetota bacterium]